MKLNDALRRKEDLFMTGAALHFMGLYLLEHEDVNKDISEAIGKEMGADVLPANIILEIGSNELFKIWNKIKRQIENVKIDYEDF